FTAAALGYLTGAGWTVRAESDRVGIRLDGPRLARARTGELTSEPTLPGALQVPPDGRPILLGPDAPVTGGYPVIAVVHDDDLDAAAQLRPGDPVTFIR
ncbi:MAG: biotin-dependent carboxyltransferase family protein, partial [Chloroflexi bacterium]|nr:biotin-dependent carboxyltransferase family protein [Chloroflexota bacterium]